MRIAKVNTPLRGTNMLPTAPIPEDLKAKPIHLTDNARTVLHKRYLRRGADGKPAETEPEMFWRVAYHVALAEAEFADQATVMAQARAYYELLTNLRFFPNSPTFTGAGTPLGQLAACFTENMRVTTVNGLKRIADLRDGDLVLTHRGRYRPVRHAYKREYAGELLTIQIHNLGTPLEVTPEHPILTMNGWVNAGDLKVGDWVAIGALEGAESFVAFDLATIECTADLELQTSESAVRVRRPSTYQNSGLSARWTNRLIPLSTDLARLCGSYVSEGTLGSDDEYVRFTFSREETDYQQDVSALLTQIFGGAVSINHAKQGTWSNINFYSRTAALWFKEHFGRHAHGKRIPYWLQQANQEIQEQFLIGLLRGDGVFYEHQHTPPSLHGKAQSFRKFGVTLSNPSLIHQIWQMCIRLGYDASVRPADTTYVTPNARPAASLNIPPVQAHALALRTFGRTFSPIKEHYVRIRARRIDNRAYYQIKSVQANSFSGTVYNCEVEEDNTYVTEGVVVHNCFVLAIDDDMGRTESGIFQTLRDAALIQQTGGGNGFAFSRLRPKGALVNSSRGEATGPVGFLRVYDQAFGEIAQGGCLTPDTLVFTEKGLLRLDELVTHESVGWRDHSLTVATDEGERHSPSVYNNGVEAVLRVSTDEGLILRGTPNHKVKVLTTQGMVWRRLDELQAGDALAVKLGQHCGTLQSLRTPDIQHGNQVMPTLPAVLDEQFAFLLGYLAGDGFVASATDDHRVGFTVAHTSYLIEEMPSLLKRILGEHITVHKQQKPNDASATFTVDNRAVKDFLLLNGLAKAKSAQVRIPRLVRQSPPHVVGAYLRGLFEADGTLSHHYPTLVSVSEQLIREAAALLIGLGVPVTITQHPESKERWGSLRMWSLRVNSFVGLKAWQTHIGCDVRSRFQACVNFLPNTARESSYTLPHAEYWVSPVLEATVVPQKDKRGRGANRNLRATEPKLRKQLLRYTRGDRQLTHSGYTLLAESSSAFAENARPIDDYWFVKVISVEPDGESLTLDLEVEGNHTYLANGIVTHNSRRGANMAVLRVDHPDIREFITAKTDESSITNFNISVGITDAFMRAVENDTDFDLINPQNGEVWETVRARDLFDLIVKQAHHNGEPGVLFLDAANRSNPVPHLYELESTNPCFVGSTRIATDRGLIAIKDLAESDQECMVATDNRAPLGGFGKPKAKTYGVSFRRASPAWKTRENAEVFKLTTEHGYSITVTPDHKFLTPDRGYIELKDLKVGDHLMLQSGEGAWSNDYTLPNSVAIRDHLAVMGRGGDYATGMLVTRRDFAAQYMNVPTHWSHSLGVVLGWLVGDGWLTSGSNSPVGMVFSAENDEAQQIVHSAMQDWFGGGHLHQRGTVNQLTYGKLPYIFFQTLGVSEGHAHEKHVPTALWTAPREAVIGFLQGLFTADGTVTLSEEKKSCDVRLASASYQLLEEVQLLLINLGIVSKIHHRRASGYRLLPDGKGGKKAYFAHDDFELIIGRANRNQFLERVGFIDSQKQDKAMRFVTSQSRRAASEAFVTKIKSIVQVENADVYDLSEPQTRSIIANGTIAHNCGEQFLGPFENCCLGSINLAQLPVKNGSPDWKTLQAWTELSTRFLDDVVSANSYVPSVPQLAEAAHRVRRIGLGVMGLADLMYKLNVRYGSAEGQEFAGQITEFVRYHTMKTSIALAKERGAFPAIKGSLYDPDDLKWQPPTPLFPYSRDWGRPKLDWDKITKGIKKHGIRNGAQMTVAPTGCLVAGSLVVTDQGILPIEQLGDLRGAQWQAVSFNVASEGGVLPATQFYLNGRAQTLKVTTKRGYTLQGTVGHRIRVWQDGAWEWRRMDEVQVGMQVPLKATGLIGAPKLVPLDTGMASNFHTTPLTLPSYMTADLAYLLGFFMGDGSLKTRSLRFAISDEASEKWLTELLQKTFGVTPTVALDERSPKLKSLEVHSVNLVAFWQQNGFAKIAPHAEHRGKGYQPHIPLAVLRTNDEAIYAAFLAGLFDADATIYLKRLVSWLTTDRQFHDQVKALLLAMGIFTTTDLQTTGLGQSTAYRLRTAHVQATQKLVEKLPYLCRIIPTGTARRQTLRGGIPITRQEHHLVLRLADCGAEHARVQSWRQRKYNVSRGSLSQFVEGHREAMLTNGLESLVATIDDEIYYDEVVAVEDGGWQDTYDISVPGTHAYVANGLISHNTIATVSGCEGYGCEPVFALAYIRHVNDKGRDLQLQYTSPLFEQALQQAKLSPAQIQRIVEYVNTHGSCQGAPDLPDHIRHTFVVSGDITAEEHIRMQAAMQRFVDNAISKTCNFFSDATPNDVATAYQLGWKLGCKGLTVYVTGSRDKVVLETHATAKTKEGEAPPEAATTSALAALNGDQDHDPEPLTLFPEAKKPRPRRLEGRTYRIGTPLGGTYITINENGQGRGHPFELFIHTSKAGSETAAISEAIGRLSSLIMRMASPILPRERVKEIIRQLEGIGGDRAIGFGPQRVRSLPDGIAQVLREYLDETSDAEEHYVPLPEGRATAPQPLLKGAATTTPPQAQLTLIGDLCPECGEASLVNEEGCRKCYNCGYSEC